MTATYEAVPSTGAQVQPVEVDEPGLSPELNAELTTELREAIRGDRAQVSPAGPHPSHEGELPRRGIRGVPIARFWIFAEVAATWAIVGLIALITVATGAGAWWLTGVAVLGLLATTGLVISMVFAMVENPERPAPTTVAWMEAEGIHDPERHFSDLVGEFMGGSESR